MKTINVHTTIDTRAIIEYMVSNNYTPSLKHEAPFAIPHSGYEFMVANAHNVVSGQATGTIHLSGAVNDKVRFSTTSISDNFEDSVFIYDIEPINPQQSTIVFGPFKAVSSLRIVPVLENPKTLETKWVNEEFDFFESSLVETGSEDFKIYFAMYIRNKDLLPELYGYFSWDPRMVVKKPN